MSPRRVFVLLAGLVLVWLPAAADAAFNVSGTVFEDPNYGGGAGRSQAASSGVARSGARVELFNAAGNFVSSTNTNGAGAYNFNALANGTYTVRVVNSTVTSSRTGYLAGLLPVQTYRTDAASSAAVDVTDRVGGEVPSRADAGNGGTTLAALTTATTAPQSITTVTSAGGNVGAVDFGFNFDTIVNVNDTGQGSLRMFLQNSNALGNVGLAIQGQAAGRDVSMFMISDGAAHAGLRAGLANLLNGSGIAVITLASALPAITAAAATIDGSTQTANIGDTNATTFGTGGTVGVDALALGTVAGPEVEIRSGATITDGLLIQADNATIRRVAILGFGAANGEAGVRVDAGFTGALIENNVLGTTAASFVDPGSPLRNQSGVYAEGINGTVRDNMIGFSRTTAVYLANPATGWSITDNELRDIGQDTADGDGVTFNAVSANSATGNLITGTSSQAFVVTAAPAVGNSFTNNTVTDNGVGLPGSLAQSAAITMRSGATSTTIDRNVVRQNYGAGIQVNSGASGTRITRNSFADNGTITARSGSGATGQIGIDLNAAGDDINFGNAPFVTLNDTGDADVGGNALLNYPILTTATLVGGTLSIAGYAAPGAVIEVFVAKADASGLGEGETYVMTLTEGGTGAGGNDPYTDLDGGSGSYGPGAINGIAQGSDNSNRFAFSFPAPGVSAGNLLTATATLGGQTSEFSGNVTVAGGISGTVFEDVNYGGGAGRSQVAAAGVARASARVELYNNAGNYVSATTTDAAGVFAFSGLANGNYTVRVVNSSVTSSRTGYIAGLLPVQTFSTDASSGSAVAVLDHVGGRNPSVADAGNGGAGTTMNTATGVFTAGIAGTAQSITNVTLGSTGAAGVDFGFNFDCVVNRNDTGAGSLRQFVLNANALANAGLAQAGRPAGIDNAIFMLADGTARPGLNAGYANQFTAGVATIAPASALPAVGSPAVIDAQTQPGWSSAPRLELNGAGAGAGASGLTLTAGGTAVRGLVINRFASSGILIATAGGDTVAGCWIGTTAAGTAAAANGSHGVRINGCGANVVGGLTPTQRNVVSGNGGYGVSIVGAAATTNIVHGNFIGLAATGTAAVANLYGVIVENGASGTVIGGTAAAARNVISGNVHSGVILQLGGVSGTLIQGNWIGTDSTGTASVSNGDYGVNIKEAETGNSIGGLVAGAGNVITASGLDGVAIADAGTRMNAVLGNAIYANGGLGITLGWDAVTPNNGTKNPGLPNDDMDFPVFASAVLAAGSLTVSGYVGSAAGQAAFAGARVEVFKSSNDASGYGEGRSLLGSLTADASGNFAGTLAAPGLVVGDGITATATDGSNNTSEFGPQHTVDPLVIVKRAFRLDGTPIPNGTVVAKGALVEFLLYVNNPGPLVPDVSLRDALDPGFAYLGGTIKTDDSQPSCASGTCSGAEEAGIFAAAFASTGASDALDGDTVSQSGTLIDAGNQNVANAQLDLAAGKVYAVVLTVRMR